MTSCLIETLKVLRGSSKEAVENIGEFNELKRYMHVKRKLQDELTDLINGAEYIAKKQLILVCGSVGDGKSHLLSYLKNEKKILNNFYLHNDATESLTPNMTSIETLDNILAGFRDENIHNGKIEKVVVAINLGTLNNFIDSEVKDKYTLLRSYVEKNCILESYTNFYEFSEDSYFQHINFCDYHLYHLIKEGNHIDSDYIRTLINKIINQNTNNPFYKQYLNCEHCNINGSCPVKHNYELLKIRQVQEAIVDILVEAMLKHKIILSTRSLLNFVYDILVDKEFTKQKYISMNYEDRIVQYVKALMPNLLYGHPGCSTLLEQVNKSDPISTRSESVDEMIIKFNILDDIGTLIKECIHDNVIIHVLEELELNTRAKESISTKKELLQLFIRLYRLLGVEGRLDITDRVYREFVDNLYYYNSNNIQGLKELYTNVKEAIFKWNGDSSKKTVIVSVGNNQFDYKISQELKITEYLEDITPNNGKEIEKFTPYITVKITDQNEKNIEGMNIDYALFKLIRDIKNGYRPNIKDKNKFVSFVSVIERIYNCGDKKKELIIESKNAENATRYLLKKTRFGFEFERI